MALFQCKNPAGMVHCLPGDTLPIQQEHLQPSTLLKEFCKANPLLPKRAGAQRYIRAVQRRCGAPFANDSCQMTKSPTFFFFFLEEKVVKGKNAGGSWLDQSQFVLLSQLVVALNKA